MNISIFEKDKELYINSKYHTQKLSDISAYKQHCLGIQTLEKVLQHRGYFFLVYFDFIIVLYFKDLYFEWVTTFEAPHDFHIEGFHIGKANAEDEEESFIMHVDELDHPFTRKVSILSHTDTVFGHKIVFS